MVSSMDCVRDEGAQEARAAVKAQPLTRRTKAIEDDAQQEDSAVGDAVGKLAPRHFRERVREMYVAVHR